MRRRKEKRRYGMRGGCVLVGECCRQGDGCEKSVSLLIIVGE